MQVSERGRTAHGGKQPVRSDSLDADRPTDVRVPLSLKELTTPRTAFALINANVKRFLP